MGGQKRRVLVIGGSFSGLLCVRDLAHEFDVTVVDAKEYFEYTPGILRAYVKPAHFDALTFTTQHVIERKLGAKFLWGEVKSVDGDACTAVVKPMFAETTETIHYDYCIVCAGCNFGPFSKWGESLWFPVIHEDAKKDSAWGHLDERFIEGRRRHVLEEYTKIQELERQRSSILIVGAGFIGVEWATELQYFFPNLNLTIIDMLPRCLGPLPDSAAQYCEDYMQKVGIKTHYKVKYDPKSQEFWDGIGLPNKADVQYVCIGVKASNYFMPPEVLSDKGPGGGGWIHMNEKLQVTSKKGEVWGGGRVFAVGDCNYGCIGDPSRWVIPPIPKISYPGEEQALHAVKNVRILDTHVTAGNSMWSQIFVKKPLMNTWWPWGSGMFATSLGPHDACFVVAANENKGSGYMVNWSLPAAIQKEIIESSKVDECKGGFLGEWIWHFVHHTPCHMWGRAPSWF